MSKYVKMVIHIMSRIRKKKRKIFSCKAQHGCRNADVPFEVFVSAMAI